MTDLTTAQHDRAAGVLLGQACGDALGVPYEFARPPGAGELAEMRGGGLGNFAPGEWSDDTSMAYAVARVAASGADLRSDDALDAIAAGFLEWYDGGPADIGIQTRAVLDVTRARYDGGPGLGALMTAEAGAYAADHPRSAGNGALMRTSPVALAHLADRSAAAHAARAVASLTHADPLAGDSSVLWTEAIRVAVLEGRFDVRGGLDLLPERRRGEWTARIDAAEREPSASFTPNGFTVTALQAAWSAIVRTPVPDLEPAARTFPCLHLQHALHAAVRIGDDTDTVAAIAGGLLGARWGASAVPWRWRRAVHGWPGGDGRDLTTMATLAANDGRPDPKGHPGVDAVPYEERASSTAYVHPLDDGVLLGTHRTVDHAATAVVSACRVGRNQPCFGEASVVVESRLQDRENADANPHLHFALLDAADAVRGLREEGHTVLLHCVAAEQRTPSIAVVYGTLVGHPVEDSRALLAGVLPHLRGFGRLWDAAGEIG